MFTVNRDFTSYHHAFTALQLEDGSSRNAKLLLASAVNLDADEIERAQRWVERLTSPNGYWPAEKGRES